MKYFVAVEDDVIGPFDLVECVNFIEPGMLVSPEHSDEWLYAEEDEELRKVLIELKLIQYSAKEEDFTINSSGEIIRRSSNGGTSSNQSQNEHNQEQTLEREQFQEKALKRKRWVIGTIVTIIIIILFSNG